jgi:uncharacterized membrane protein
LATLTVLKFHTATGADQAINVLKDLQRQELIRIHDAAIVRWPDGAKKPKTEQLSGLAAAGAWGGAFWGFLFGLLFFVPLLGMAIGAGIGALTGRLADVGIDDKFINEVKTQVTPGTSALFLLTSDAVTDRVVDAARDMQFEIIATNLTGEQEAKLREAFAEEETTKA